MTRYNSGAKSVQRFSPYVATDTVHNTVAFEACAIAFSATNSGQEAAHILRLWLPLSNPRLCSVPARIEFTILRRRKRPKTRRLKTKEFGRCKERAAYVRGSQTWPAPECASSSSARREQQARLFTLWTTGEDARSLRSQSDAVSASHVTFGRRQATCGGRVGTCLIGSLRHGLTRSVRCGPA